MGTLPATETLPAPAFASGRTGLNPSPTTPGLRRSSERGREPPTTPNWAARGAGAGFVACGPAAGAGEVRERETLPLAGTLAGAVAFLAGREKPGPGGAGERLGLDELVTDGCPTFAGRAAGDTEAGAGTGVRVFLEAVEPLPLVEPDVGAGVRAGGR